jgi:hypothetical protein
MNMPDELIALAERCERAEASEQRALLTQAFEVVHGRQLAAGWETEDGRCETNARLKFDRMLDAGAFESAAMTLVPEGCGGSFTFFKDGTAKAFVWQPYPLAIEVRAATITLALCAAALRARANTEPTP